MLHQLLQYVSSMATYLVTAWGYWGIFIGMIIESACIPLSSEAIMLFGGFMSAQGYLNLWGVVWAGILGNVVGSVLTFWIGSKGGRVFLQNYGKYVFFNEEHLEKADQWFSRYGEWAVFFSRNLPVVRTFISLPAGISRMNFNKFFIYTFIGVIPWNLALTFLGLKLGQNWAFVETYSRPLSYAMLGMIVLGVVYFIFKSLTKQKRKRTNI